MVVVIVVRTACVTAMVVVVIVALLTIALLRLLFATQLEKWRGGAAATASSGAARVLRHGLRLPFFAGRPAPMVVMVMVTFCLFHENAPTALESMRELKTLKQL
ncbi:hypothetical protein [Lampropedia aestuarii]|uniref:hypothetical protein n=1 Tax=Lampropedia aestuarii TaxID=2562762 RepID=UPI0024697BC6|nr:hypothetical protein [Lampropedia aestuarii]MDH5857744.1 hypothetical protein [Lampropedia aestuarii]